ncbi:MAG TPA: hypothetical protein VIE65_12265 [Methylobacter sp.]|jgi:hypothetical protein
MAKYVVNNNTQTIINGSLDPFTGSVAGRYLIDVPDYLNIKPVTNVPADLYAAKQAAFLIKYPSMRGVVSSEDLSSTLDQSKSNRFIVGPNKGVGFITNPTSSIWMTNTFNVPIFSSQVLVHFNAFYWIRVPNSDGSPDKILYNWDPVSQTFITYNTTSIIIDVMDSTGTTSLLTVTPDTIMNLTFGSGNYRLRFTNGVPETGFFFGDYYLLYG